MLGGLKFADEKGLRAIPSLGRADPYGSTSEGQKGWSWTDYFETASSCGVQPVIPKNPAVIGGLQHPYPSILDLEPAEIRRIFSDHSQIRSEVRKFVEFNAPFVNGESTLGVHYRAGDMRSYAIHPTPPSERFMISLIRSELSTGAYSRIYVATESKKFIRMVRRAFGNEHEVIHGYKADKSSSARGSYLSDIKVIADAHYLGACRTLLHSRSNVAWAAFVFSDGTLQKAIEIDLGANPSFAPWAIVKGRLLFHITAPHREKSATLKTRYMAS